MTFQSRLATQHGIRRAMRFLLGPCTKEDASISAANIFQTVFKILRFLFQPVLFTDDSPTSFAFRTTCVSPHDRFGSLLRSAAFWWCVEENPKRFCAKGTMSSAQESSPSTSGTFHGTPSKDALRNFLAGSASGFA